MKAHADPKVSVIITFYNAASYLGEAIASVITQTYPDWELILWDDGSTDHSAVVAKAYADKHSRIHLYQSENQGQVSCLKQAHSLVQGDYVGVLDADDLLAPTALAKTVRFLDQNPLYGMVYTNYQVMDSQGKLRQLGSRCQIRYSPKRLLVDFMTFHFRLIRKKVLEAVGDVNPNVQMAWDYDLCLRLSEVTSIYHLQEVLYFYRVHSHQKSKQKRLKQIRASEKAINQALQRRGLAEVVKLEVDPSTNQFRLVPLT